MFLSLLLPIFISSVQAATVSVSVSPALIQNSVVLACDQINNHSPCPLAKRSLKTIARNLPPAISPPVAPAAQIPPVVLSRCNPDRKDAPPSTQIQNVNQAEVPMSTLSPDEAQQVFQYVDKQKSRYALSSKSFREAVCRERAHLIAYDLADVCKVKSAKIFVRPSRSIWSLYLGRNSLEVQARGEDHRWDTFHVANVIMVNKNGDLKPYVVDPVLFDHAVPLSEWKSLMSKNDSAASFMVTSPSAFNYQDADHDDPNAELVPGFAEQNMDKAKARYRKMETN